MDKAFISFSSKDEDILNKITEKFDLENINYWMCKRDIEAGVKYAESITLAIKSCKYFLVLISKNSNISQHVANEINIAVMHNKVIIPIIIDDVKLSPSMEYYIASYQWISWNNGENIDFLISMINGSEKKEIIGETNNIVNEDLDEFSKGQAFYYGTDGYEKDIDDAIYWYKKAASHNDGRGACNLGWCYEIGMGVEQSWKNALNWYVKASEMNNSMGQYSLGWMYEQGIYVAKNQLKAFEFYRAAAENGHDISQYKVGLAFQEGSFVDQDYEKANEYFELSAEQGHVAAQYKLAENYYFGLGAKRDVIKAKNMWLLSSEMGYIKSHEALEKYYDIFYNSSKKSFDI